MFSKANQPAMFTILQVDNTLSPTDIQSTTYTITLLYNLLTQREFWNATNVFNQALNGKVETNIKGSLFDSQKWRGLHRNILFNKNISLNYSKESPI